MKSLFIASVSRAGSSSLQSILADGLHLVNAHKPLDSEDNILQKSSSAIRAFLLSMSEGHIIRDVDEPQFIVENIEWLLAHFNVIFLFRNEKDVIKSHCLRETNWSGLPAAMRVLQEISEQYSVPVLRYEDFIQSSYNLLKIVEQMYGTRMADYQTELFREKQRSEKYLLKDIEIKPRDAYWSNVASLNDAKEHMEVTLTVPSEIPKRIGSHITNDGILDFGCGLGRLLRHLKNETDWKMTGFDLPNMIDLCGVNDLEQIELSSSWGVIKNKSFDVILASLALQHLPPNMLYTRLREFTHMSRYLYVISRSWNDWSYKTMKEIIGQTKWKVHEEYTTWGTGLTSHFESLYKYEPDLPLNVLSLSNPSATQRDVSVSSKKNMISTSIQKSLFDHLEDRRKIYDVSVDTLSDWLLNRKLAIMERNERKIHLSSRPLYLDIELNNMCNLTCEFCTCVHGHVQKPTLPEAQLTKDEIDQISHLFKYAEIMETSKAGEPFLTPNLFSYALGKIREANPFVIVQTVTNGTALSSVVVDDLIKNKLDHMYISINGETREKYHEIMGKDLFDKVVANLAMTQEAKRLSGSAEPYLHFNVQLCSLSDPFAILKMAHKLGVIEVNFIKTQMGPGNYRFEGKPIQDYMEPEEINDLMRKIVEEANHLRISVNFPGWAKHNFRILGSPQSFYYPHITKYFDSDLACPTDAPWFRFCTAMRNVEPCCWSGVFDQWKDKPFEEIWNGDYLKGMRQKLSSGIYPGVCHCRY